MAAARWGGLRPEPYKNDAVDADNDGIVQEGTIWERPVGSKFLDEFGNDFRGGLDGNNITQLNGLRLVDSSNKPIAYRQSWRAQNLTLAEQFGTLQTSLGSLEGPPAAAPLVNIDAPEFPISASKLAELKQEYPSFFKADDSLIDRVSYPWSADVFFAGQPLYDDLSKIESWGDFRDFLKSKRIVAFDTETTGHMNENSGMDRIVQLGAVVYENGEIVDRYNTYINIPYDSLSDWSRTNLLTPDGVPLSEDFLSEQLSASTALVDFYRLAFDTPDRDNVVFLAHNAPFDIERMATEFRRNSDLYERLPDDLPMDISFTPYIDTMQLARASKRFGVDGAPDAAALKKLQEFFGMEDFKWHSADADAEMAGDILWKLVDFLEEKDASLDVIDVAKGVEFQRAQKQKFDKSLAEWPEKVATLQMLKETLAGARSTSEPDVPEVSDVPAERPLSLISSKVDKDKVPLAISVPFDPDAIGKQPYELRDYNDTYKQTIRGVPISLDDPIVPDELYHASPAASKIMTDGTLRAGGVGGLGGDKKDRVVSLTTDRAIAEGIAADMRLVVNIAKANKANDRGAVLAFLRKNIEDSNIELAQDNLKRLEYLADTGDVKQAINEYLVMRESAGGPRNPIFFNLDLDKMASYNVEDIGVVSVKKNDLDTGAMVTNFDVGKGFLEELRIYGDVNISGITNTPAPVVERARFTGDLLNTGDGIDSDSIDDVHAEAIVKKFKKWGLDRKSLRDELERALSEASPELFAKASEWYRQISDRTRKMSEDFNAKYGTNISFEEAAAVVAALSPAREFGKNVRDANKLLTVFAADEEFTLPDDIEDILKPDALNAYLRFKERFTGTAGVLRPSDVRDDELPFLIASHPMLKTLGNKTGLVNVVRAFDAVRSGDIDRTMSGPKMRSFYSNIVNPDGDRVTIDTWMYRAMIDPKFKFNTKRGLLTLDEYEASGGQVQDLFQSSPSSKLSNVPNNVGLYPEFADASREVAARYGLSPAALQAIVWEVQRMRDGYAATDWAKVSKGFEVL